MPTELISLNAAPPTSGSDDNMPKVAWAHGCLEESIAPTNGFTNAIPTTAREQTTHEMGVKRVLKSTVVAGTATGSQANNKKKRSCRPNPDKTLDKKTRNITNTRKRGLLDNHSSGSATSRPFLAKEENGLADIHNLPCVDGEKAIPGGGGEKPRSSQYRGVTKHKRSGRWEAYDHSGNIRERGSYQDGQEDGVWSTYSADGVLQEEGNMRRGERHGRWRFFHSEGHLEVEGDYADGRRFGAWFDYDADGRAVRQRSYEAGRLIQDIRLELVDSEPPPESGVRAAPSGEEPGSQ